MRGELAFDHAFWRDVLENDETYCLSLNRGISSVEHLNISDELLQKLNPSILMKTSGSSGAAKWVVCSKGTILRHAALVNDHLNVTKDDVFGLMLPAHHVGGLGVITRAHLSGAKIIAYSSKWSAGSCVEFLTEENVSVLSLVPTQLVDIVNEVLYCPESVRVVVIGGGKINSEVRAAAIGLGWSIQESYGMTETGSQIATGQFNESGYLSLISGWLVRSNEDGLLEVKGDCLLEGYLIEHDSGWQFLDPKKDGWFTTSDRVDVQEIDGKMGVKFLSRSDQQVKILGELVDVSLLEGRLLEMMKDEVYLIPLPDVRRGVKLYPVVEVVEMVELIGGLGWSGLEKLEDPVLIKKFPRNAMGKLQRAKLADLVESVVFSAG